MTAVNENTLVKKTYEIWNKLIMNRTIMNGNWRVEQRGANVTSCKRLQCGVGETCCNEFSNGNNNITHVYTFVCRKKVNQMFIVKK